MSRTDDEMTAWLRGFAGDPPDEETVRRFRESLRRYHNDPAERERIERIVNGLLDDEGGNR